MPSIGTILLLMGILAVGSIIFGFSLGVDYGRKRELERYTEEFRQKYLEHFTTIFTQKVEERSYEIAVQIVEEYEKEKEKNNESSCGS